MLYNYAHPTADAAAEGAAATSAHVAGAPAHAMASDTTAPRHAVTTPVRWVPLGPTAAFLAAAARALIAASAAGAGLHAAGARAAGARAGTDAGAGAGAGATDSGAASAADVPVRTLVRMRAWGGRSGRARGDGCARSPVTVTPTKPARRGKSSF